MNDQGGPSDGPQMLRVPDVWAQPTELDEEPVPYGESATLRALARMMHPSYRDRLRHRRRVGRARGRVVTWERIVQTYHELRDETDKRPSQADVARRLKEPVRNVERACGDSPGAWRRLTRA